MDEVGFMVSEIRPDGTFRVVEIGGWNPMVVSSQRFKLFTRDGREIPVISGSVPPHLTRGTGGPTMPAISDIIFDGGFADKAEAESFGIRPSDTIVPDSSAILTANEKNIISKAWDNRYGVLMISELAEALSGQKNWEMNSILVLMSKKKLVCVVLILPQPSLTQKSFWQLTVHLLVMFMVVKARLGMEL